MTAEPFLERCLQDVTLIGCAYRCEGLWLKTIDTLVSKGVERVRQYAIGVYLRYLKMHH